MKKGMLGVTSRLKKMKLLRKVCESCKDCESYNSCVRVGTTNSLEYYVFCQVLDNQSVNDMIMQLISSRKYN